MRENDLKILKTVFPDNNWRYLTKTVAYPYDNLNCLNDYQKSDNDSKKEGFFRKLENKCPCDEKNRTNKRNYQKIQY